ncbi:hypothetical protein BH09ACT11_BH09ACT11_12500 [soil metagenome]
MDRPGFHRAETPSDFWSSTFPAWLEALATVAAVIAAVYAGYYAYRAFGIERARDEQRDADKRSAQASEVAVWASGAGEFTILNGSKLPIFDVTVEFRGNPSRGATGRGGRSGQ